MPRFFAKEQDCHIEDHQIFLREEDAHHIAYSLRMAEGDSLIVCDTQGQAYSCILETIRPDYVSCKIVGPAPKTESPLEITLYMGYPKGDKLETIIQKAVELGVKTIVPFESAFCIKRPPKERLAKIMERLNRIAEEAAKQSGRTCIPKVLSPITYKELLVDAQKQDINLFAYEGEHATSLKTFLSNQAPFHTCGCIVGSEGGFSAQEIEQALDAGFQMVHLGPRILRCETAPSYILSCLSFLYEL